MNFCNQDLDMLATTASCPGMATPQLQPSQSHGVSATSSLVVNSLIHSVEHSVLINSDIGTAPSFSRDCDVYLAV